MVLKVPSRFKINPATGPTNEILRLEVAVAVAEEADPSREILCTTGHGSALLPG